MSAYDEIKAELTPQSSSTDRAVAYFEGNPDNAANGDEAAKWVAATNTVGQIIGFPGEVLSKSTDIARQNQLLRGPTSGVFYRVTVERVEA